MCKALWCGLLLLLPWELTAVPLFFTNHNGLLNVKANLEAMLELQQQQLNQQLRRSGVSAHVLDEIVAVLMALNNPYLRVAIKLTDQVDDAAATAVDLPEDLRNYAKAFVVNYRYFLDILHKYVYQKAGLATLQLPCLLLFDTNNLLLSLVPINQAGDTALTELLPQLLREQLRAATKLQKSSDATCCWLSL